MAKSVFSRNYRVFLEVLRNARLDREVTQEQLGKRVRWTQTQVSKVERGERRLDIVELRAWCKALEMSLAEFVDEFERRLR